MKRIKIALWLVLGLLAASWLLADSLWPQPLSYFGFRSVAVQLSGVLAMGAMSVAMVLATRPLWLERRLDGLDKMYRLHKWLGIAALVAGVTHWWLAQGTKWMVGWGWLQRPQRGPRQPIADPLLAWMQSQRGLAENMGEWAFYGAALLIVLALIQRFPYRLFAKTHKLLALAYLVLAWHAAILIKTDYWTQPVGWLMALLVVAGVVSAVLVLLGRVGAARKAHGQIVDLQYFEPLQVLRTTIALPQGWHGHAPGQFAFVTSDGAEGAHPYTIASAWDERQRQITFVTKALGDHTARLHQRLRAGQTVTVEGPYGCFDFDDTAPRQVWIGGGIGITPFIARMKHRAQQRAEGHAPTQAVDLFHTTRDEDPAALALLRADAQAADVRLHLLVDARDGLLTPERIAAAVPDWPSASFWFCGPTGFGQALRAAFTAQGLPSARFHQELFAMR